MSEWTWTQIIPIVQCVLRRLETSISVDSASTYFLGLTTGYDKAGVFSPHGRIPIFTKFYTGGPEEVSVLLCPCGPKSSRSITEGSEEAGAPVTMNAAPSFQKPQLMS